MEMAAIKISRRKAMAAVAAYGIVGSIATSSSKEAQEANSSWRSQKRYQSIQGLKMAYYEVGAGDPIVFLHGNPTSSYLWRNIVPHVQHLGRCIAPDLIGMGDSDKLPNSGAKSYFFEEHQKYLYGLLAELDVRDRVTFVVHDWGSALGITWAKAHPERIRGLAFMEAILEAPGKPTPAQPVGSSFDIMRSPKGEQFILQENNFIEYFVKQHELYMTPEDAAEYRRPFLEPGESRRPTLSWPRQLPLGGEPKDMYERVLEYSKWLADDRRIPKLFIQAVPGALLSSDDKLEFVRGFKKQTEVTVFGRHWVQEVSPAAIGRALAGWLTSLAA
jgi:haloalkane dehalogenase